MHSSSTWANLAKKEQSKSFPSNLIYHSGFIDVFPTKIFRDFQAVGDWAFDKSFIRYNDDDIQKNIESNEELKLTRSLFDHPYNLFINTKYLSGYEQQEKINFYLTKMNLFTRLRLEYDELLSNTKNFGYFTTADNKTSCCDIETNKLAYQHAMEKRDERFKQYQHIEEITKHWVYLFVFPTTVYLDRLAFQYKHSSQQNQVSEVSEENEVVSETNKIGVYCPW